jgi:hypothetical protein
VHCTASHFKFRILSNGNVLMTVALELSRRSGAIGYQGCRRSCIIFVDVAEVDAVLSRAYQVKGRLSGGLVQAPVSDRRDQLRIDRNDYAV